MIQTQVINRAKIFLYKSRGGSYNDIVEGVDY